jgi:outer membrane biogenesis lipoprotein LolB
LTRVAALALAAMAAACAVTPSPQSALPSLAAVPASFEMSGRLALRQGDRSEIARLRWAHSPGGDRWVISSPLGNEMARIESSTAGATLARAGGESDEAASFAELTEKLLGVALDPAVLVGWLHGAGLERAGEWSVTVDETGKAGTVDISRRLTARRGDVTVRLAVDEYRSLDPPR